MSSQTRPRILALLVAFLAGALCAFMVSSLWPLLVDHDGKTTVNNQVVTQPAPRGLAGTLSNEEEDDEWGSYNDLDEDEHLEQLERDYHKKTMREIDRFWRLAATMEVDAETRVAIRFEDNPNLTSRKSWRRPEDMPENTSIDMSGDGGVLQCLKTLGAVRYALSSSGDGGTGAIRTWHGSVTVSNSSGTLSIGIDAFGFVAGDGTPGFQNCFFCPRLAALVAEEYARVHGRELPSPLVESLSGERWLKNEMEQAGATVL